MAYVQVPKDLTRVKTKILFNLTKRQLICFGLAGIIGIPLYFLTKGALGNTVSAMLMILAMMPCFVFAIYEKDGRTLEQILKNIYEMKVKRPAIRSYQTENFYTVIQEEHDRVRTKMKDGHEYSSILSGNQKKRMVQKKIRDKKNGKFPQTVQQSIPYKAMYRDGICKVDDRHYTKCIQFGDINYQLAQNEDKAAAFEQWCDCYNYFDPSISIQINCMNQYVDVRELEKSIELKRKQDGFDDIRDEYEQVLKIQRAKGNNGLIRKKHLIFGVEAESLKVAKPRLERIETDIINNFKAMGVSARALSGYERLKLLYHAMNEQVQEPFVFHYDMVTRTGLSTKDYIAPSSFHFGNKAYFQMGKRIGAVSFLQILAPELSDRMLAEFLDMDQAITINLHVQSIDQSRAIRQIKMKITDLEKMKIDEQKRAVRSGYDMDVLPPDLVTYLEEAKKLLEDLQSRNERMFLVTILIMNTSDSKRTLDNIVLQTAGIAQKYNCALRRLDYQQEAGLMSSLPIGVNFIDIQRGLTTSATAIFVPFITEELNQDGEALYYGINAISNNMIMADRKRLKNPNGLILGTPGSGKSFSAKREITNAFLLTTDDIIISDPEGEYSPLVHMLKGQVIEISPNSKQYINPMDINLNYSEEDSPISLKADFVLSLCELIVGSKSGLEPVEKTIIDRCVRLVYRAYLEDPVPEKMPILEDLYHCILEQEEAEAKRLATALEIYVTGSLNVFNHRTNVDVNNRLVCFDIKELGKQLKKIGMLVVQDQVWNRVTVNRAEYRSTRYYIDELHLLLREEQTAAYTVEIWKRFRKWGGIPTGITQNVKDLLASREIENIFENSDFIYMLNQAGGDRQILAGQLNISPRQLSFVTNSNEGEGLLFYGNTIIPFKDQFPKETMLYRIMTTKVSDLKEMEEVEHE